LNLSTGDRHSVMGAPTETESFSGVIIDVCAFLRQRRFDFLIKVGKVLADGATGSL